METIAAAISALLLAAITSASPTDNCPYQAGEGKGKCPQIKPMPNLDFKQYSGIWYELFHGESVNYQCAKFNYQYMDGATPKYNIATDALDQDGKTKIQGNSDVLLDKSCQNPNGKYMDFQAGMDSEGRNYLLPPDLDLFVLDTDYTSYTVEYGCDVNENGDKTESLCVQFRETKPNLTKDQINAILVKNGISTDILTDSRPKTCDKKESS